jgi:hypothetical protein
MPPLEYPLSGLPSGLCPHRQAYLAVMGMWGPPRPGAPGAGAVTEGGRLAPGPDGADREAAFRGWYLVTHEDLHIDPCEPSAA